MPIQIYTSEPVSDNTKKLIRAEKYHLKGELQEAWDLYKEILRSESDHYAALHGMGLIAAQVKNMMWPLNSLMAPLRWINLIHALTVI